MTHESTTDSGVFTCHHIRAQLKKKKKKSQGCPGQRWRCVSSRNTGLVRLQVDVGDGHQDGVRLGLLDKDLHHLGVVEKGAIDPDGGDPCVGPLCVLSHAGVTTRILHLHMRQSQSPLTAQVVPLRHSVNGDLSPKRSHPVDLCSGSAMALQSRPTLMPSSRFRWLGRCRGYEGRHCSGDSSSFSSRTRWPLNSGGELHSMASGSMKRIVVLLELIH
ncbi:hypothetical protein INR49_007937 [Caranx melampygus]|nr:hypothetical protein INR49_007937 [Caranx melampygus]